MTSVYQQLCAVAVVFHAFLHHCSSSHFRGGIITWKPIPDGPTNSVLFNFKLAWRRSYSSSSYYCDNETIDDGQLVGGGNYWQCVAGDGCSSTPNIGSTKYQCTAFSDNEDWSQGENTFNYTFPSSGPFIISFKSGDWINTLVVGAGERWSVSTTVDLLPRTDNGKINSSPISGTSPIIRLQQGCSYNLPIHTDDPDGDEVRCRWAQKGHPDQILSGSTFDSYDNDECAGVCNGVPGATLHSVPCTLVLPPALVGWYAVALVLEDFPSPEAKVPLSEVPLQFLLEVRPSERTDSSGSNTLSSGDSEESGSSDSVCSTSLSFTKTTLEDRICIAIRPGDTFSSSIVVTEHQTAVQLREVLLVAPIGLKKSSIRLYGSFQRGVQVTWKPSPEQYGQHVFCFSAMDETGQTTEQRCLTLLAGANPPRILPETMTPYGTGVATGVRLFTVKFDQEVRRPSLTRHIKLMKVGDEHDVLAEFNTFDDDRVSIVNNTLSFSLDLLTLESNSAYYVIIEPGAVVGLQSCHGGGSPFQGLMGKRDWYIETAVETTHPCEKNGGKGDCEFKCSRYLSTYQCWCDHNNGFDLAPDGHSCYRLSGRCDSMHNCNPEHGICRGNKCECRFGWRGETCSEPACHYLAECSGNGECISPGKCSCRPGWGGPACNVELCSQYRDCETCSQHTGCGWCAGTKPQCMSGSGYGPTNQQCESWWYYYCFGAVPNLSDLPVCSDTIEIIDCSKDCINNEIPQTSGPGSYDYCQKYHSACNNYSHCYTKTPGCLTWNEDDCRFGLIPPFLPNEGDNRIAKRGVTDSDANGAAGVVKDLLDSGAFGKHVVDEVLRRIGETGIFPEDHGLLRKIAWVETEFGKKMNVEGERRGIWPIDEKQMSRTQTADVLKKKRDAILREFGIDWQSMSMDHLSKPFLCGLAARLTLSGLKEEIPRKLRDQADFWQQHFNPTGITARFIAKQRHFPKISQPATGPAKCFAQICSTNNENSIRGSDSHGTGSYGAPRSGSDSCTGEPRVHQGIDISCDSESTVYAPFTAQIVRKSRPYSDDSDPANDGLLLRGMGQWTGMCAMMWYFTPNVETGVTVSLGERIGISQSLTKKYPGISEHIHIELFSGADNGKCENVPRCERQYVDATPYSEDCGGCEHGIYHSKTGSCVCAPDYEGDKCDRPACGCGLPVCSGNGRCVFGVDLKPRCQCSGSWEGQCCKTRPPTQSFGDPHLQTIDGFEFNYFGIGEFISCYSEENEFGVQLRFFKFKHTSMIGAAAVKVGTGVFTIISVPSTEGKTRLPHIRINGTILVARLGSKLQLGGNSVTVFMRKSHVSNSLLQLFFQFRSGATYTIEVRYSESLGRQFLDTSLGAPASFTSQTKGLCGNMDGDPLNDYESPNGTLLDDPDSFAESWRVVPGLQRSDTAGYVWSWNHSNFHSDDPMTSDYTDPNHQPRYGLDTEDPDKVTIAREKCQGLGLQQQLLDDCTLDLVVTEDDVFLQQQAFNKGRCPLDCSNHGDCLNGTCFCHGLWTGSACDEGGCNGCPSNSTCINGFCTCNFGFYSDNGECRKASCANVNDCTSPAHGRCRSPDDCLCNPGFDGVDCSQRIACPDNCYGHGVCNDQQECICDPNWGGDRCNLPTCGDLQNCLRHGNCTDRATCICDSGWYGSNCGLPSCQNVLECSSQGQCVAPDTCDCNVGFAGADCSEPTQCPILNNCSNNGVCVSAEECLCFFGYMGVSCDTPVCSAGCNGRGVCSGPDFCECQDGWIGADCSQPSCDTLKFCTGHGSCVGVERCLCDDYWKGEACDVPDCSSPGNASLQCYGHGQCLGPGLCSCDESWYGDLCQTNVNLLKAKFANAPNDVIAELEILGQLVNIGTPATALVGDNMVISCYVHGHPTPAVHFFHDGVLVKTENNVSNAYLVLNDLALSAAGTYRCKANNSHGADVLKSVINVFELPQISTPRQQVTAVIKESVTLECRARGYPHPITTWTYGNDNSPVTHSGVNVSSDGSKLTFNSVTKEHEGTYTCSASNVAGTETRQLQLNVSECRSRFSMNKVPPCLVTVVLADESKTMSSVNTRLYDVCMELERQLQAAGIGTGKLSNKYAVVGFGTDMKARIVSVKSARLFSVDKVEQALQSLRRDADRPDGFNAIAYALKHLPLRQLGVRSCPLHLLISTHEPRTDNKQMSKKRLETQLCMKQPLAITAILPGGFAVGPLKRYGLGVDSTLSAYVSVKGGIANVSGKVAVLPKAYSVCQSFKDYGVMALQHHGSVWDAYRLMLSSADTISPIGRTLANVTVTTVVNQFRTCQDCACKVTDDGRVVYNCQTVKHPYYCSCRSEGNKESECKTSANRKCQDGNVAVGESAGKDPTVLLPPECR